MTLKVDNITAGYTQVPVIKGVSFEVQSGEICGLIGLNGAGKSTIIKCITNFIQPFSGEISIQGHTVAESVRDYRKLIAVIPETPVLYEELTFREHIELTARAYQQDTPETMHRAMELVEQFRLTKQLDWFPAYFSKGMKQKVLIVCALMLDVPLYVVDEPFLGLDPLGIRTLLMSTHVLDTAEKYCDRFIVLHDGLVQAQGDLETLKGEVQIDETSLEDVYFALTTNTGDHHE